MRSLMTPFMQNICKCYQTGQIEWEKKENICDEIIKTASPYVNPELKIKLNAIIFQTESNKTLKLQQQDLENFNLR